MIHPVASKHVLLRRPSNVDHAPHSGSKTKHSRVPAQPSLREASRRRRARTNRVVSAGTRTVLERAKLRNRTVTPPAPISVIITEPITAQPTLPTVQEDAPAPTPAPAPVPAPAAPANAHVVHWHAQGQILKLPRTLPVPEMNIVTKDKLAAIDHNAAVPPLQWMKDTLLEETPRWYEDLSKNKATFTPPLRDTVPVTINEPKAAMPSHVFAIHKTNPAPLSTTPDGHVYLQAVHSLPFALHCAELPTFPPSSASAPTTAGAQIELPVVHIHLPYPEHFPTIHKFLYQKRAKDLQEYLLPRIPARTWASVRNAKAISPDAQVGIAANKLHELYSFDDLLKRVIKIETFWKDVVALGIRDTSMWAVMSFCWQVAVAAVILSQPPAPQPAPAPAQNGNQ
ncbi:hypothetical protein K474DRAFT_178049 [Panus rudis PR-1116 ss-1]|nr:hypothetical protein K474DRAFT_178049 [Panus rudis PR-1116 ss-1]